MLTCCLCLSNFQVKILLFSFQFGLFYKSHSFCRNQIIWHWAPLCLLGFGHSTITGKTLLLLLIFSGKNGEDEALDFFTKYFTSTKCNIFVGCSSPLTNAPVILAMRSSYLQPKQAKLEVWKMDPNAHINQPNQLFILAV